MGAIPLHDLDEVATKRDLEVLRLEILGSTDARFAAVDTRLDRVDARLDGIDGRLDRIDNRLDGVDGRLDRIDSRLIDTNKRFDGLELQVALTAQRLDHVNEFFSDVRKEMRQIRWSQHGLTRSPCSPP